jgi:hypothetical protein
MNKSNLILHCGARAIDRATLSNIPCPAHTETWHPISHIELVLQIERALVASKMQIVHESYGVTENNARMFGLLQIQNCNNANDYAMVVGIRGALDKSLSRGLAVGSSVFVCDNLAFSSEITMFRKQTKNIMDDLPAMVDAAIGQLAARWNDQDRRIAAYKNKEIGIAQADHFLAKLAGEVFPWQKFKDIRAEFQNPRHSEFQKETLWALFNAVTEFLKPGADSKASGLWTMPFRTGLLHKACDDFAGITMNIAATVVPPTIEVIEPAPADSPVLLFPTAALAV